MAYAPAAAAFSRGRFVRAGGFVANKRVNGQIAVSRALGDFAFKGGALGDRGSCVPDLTSVKLRDGDDFLLIGCDGVFDVLTSAEATSFVRDRLGQGRNLDDAAMDLVRHAFDDREAQRRQHRLRVLERLDLFLLVDPVVDLLLEPRCHVVFLFVLRSLK